jgi:signal transduction histidine kinase
MLLVVVIIGIVVVGRSVRRAAVPLGQLMEATTRVADGEIDVRVQPRGPRDVRRLIDAFNTMADRLGQAEELRRRLLADVGHELRTPLTVIQGQLEGALDGVYERDDAHLGAILEETRHMSRIVEDLRILSLAESGALPLDRRATSLEEIVDDAIDGQTRAAATGGVTVTAILPPDLPAVDVDPTRLREVLDNVLTNAIRYTPSGGTVTVTARREDPNVRVLVADTGRGIPPDELGSVFERFHRSPDSRGSGLGLAIARDLVRAHGGEMDAESDGAGQGTTIRLTLPIAAGI